MYYSVLFAEIAVRVLEPYLAVIESPRYTRNPSARHIPCVGYYSLSIVLSGLYILVRHMNE
jgi:hypothetical protein